MTKGTYSLRTQTFFGFVTHWGTNECVGVCVGGQPLSTFLIGSFWGRDPGVGIISAGDQ